MYFTTPKLFSPSYRLRISQIFNLRKAVDEAQWLTVIPLWVPTRGQFDLINGLTGDVICLQSKVKRIEQRGLIRKKM